jgi:hypothetical protein
MHLSQQPGLQLVISTPMRYDGCDVTVAPAASISSAWGIRALCHQVVVCNASICHSLVNCLQGATSTAGFIMAEAGMSDEMSAADIKVSSNSASKGGVAPSQLALHYGHPGWVASSTAYYSSQQHLIYQLHTEHWHTGAYAHGFELSIISD